MRSGFGLLRAKRFVTSMSATAVICPGLADLRGSVTVNGKMLSRTGTRTMRYSLPEAIAHVSRGEQLYPGELFSSGTLPGGCGMELGRWLAPGDDLRLELEGIGVIEHRIQE